MELETHLRIPLPEPYGYIELRWIDPMAPEELQRIFEEYTKAFKVGGGLEQREWNEVLDNYRRDKGMSAPQMEQMSQFQKWMIHELDKSNLRLARAAAEVTGESVNSFKVKNPKE